MKQQTTAFSLPSEHRLKAYTVAATAAGIGALCSGPAAEAKVVYTPANVKIVRNIGLVLFDVNHDGIADFGLSNTWVVTSRTRTFVRVAQLRQGNEIWGAYSSNSGAQILCAAALPRGAKIGPKGQFQKDPSSGLEMAANGGRGSQFGPWAHVKQAYLGLKFVIKGETHFGWARVKISGLIGSGATVILTGYAYETIPGKPIIAGATEGLDKQTGSLGALAAGVVGR
jgi:hypothetical protein